MGSYDSCAARNGIQKPPAVEMGNIGGYAEPFHIFQKLFSRRLQPVLKSALAAVTQLILAVPCQGY